MEITIYSPHLLGFYLDDIPISEASSKDSLWVQHFKWYQARDHVLIVVVTEIKGTSAYSQDAQSIQQGFSVPRSIFPCFPPLLWPYCYLGLLWLPREIRKFPADPKRWDECSWKGTSGAKKNQRLMSRSKVWNTKCGLHSCVSFLGWFSYAQTTCLMSNWLGDTKHAILFPHGSRMSCANSSSFRVWVRVHNERKWGQPTREKLQENKGLPDWRASVVLRAKCFGGPGHWRSCMKHQFCSR